MPREGVECLLQTSQTHPNAFLDNCSSSQGTRAGWSPQAPSNPNKSVIIFIYWCNSPFAAHSGDRPWIRDQTPLPQARKPHLRTGSCHVIRSLMHKKIHRAESFHSGTARKHFFTGFTIMNHRLHYCFITIPVPLMPGCSPASDETRFSSLGHSAGLLQLQKYLCVVCATTTRLLLEPWE